MADKFSDVKISTITSTNLKRMTVLTKEQFGESGMPGAQFVKSQALQHPSASKYSLTRAALMGLLGAGAGVGVGKYAKKSKVAGGVIGGVSGVAASLIYDALRKGEEFDVAAAGVTAQGKGAIMLVAPKRLIVDLKAHKPIHLTMHFRPIILSSGEGIASEYPGWAGAIMQHGFLVQRCMMHYIHQHAKYAKPFQVEPHYGYHVTVAGLPSYMVNGNGVFMSKSKDYMNGTLWTNRFAEWPSPIFKDYGVGTPKTGDVQNAIADLIIKRTITSSGTSSIQTNSTSMRPSVGQYANRLNHYKDNRKVKPDGWFESGTRMDQFNLRYGRTVQRAQWFVWAAEMFRVHSGLHLSKIGGSGLHNWWYDHCAQWGIGCADDNRVSDKHTMLSYDSDIWLKDQTGKVHPYTENPMITGISPGNAIEYLKLVAQVTPPPFTTKIGDQITIWPDGATREFLDFPEDFLGSIVPPMDLINKDWYESLVAVRLSQGAPKWIRVMLYIVSAIVDLVCTVYGGPLGVIIGAVFSCMMTLTRLAMSNQGKIGIGDISKIIGTLASAITDAVDLSAVTGSFTDMLNNFQSVLDDAGLTTVMQGFLDVAESLSSTQFWPYINDLLGTTNDVEQSVGMDVEGAIARL